MNKKIKNHGLSWCWSFVCPDNYCAI